MNFEEFEDAKSGVNSAKAAGVKRIIAINSNPDNLRTLLTLPGVISGSRDFTEITVESLFG
ncbi:hypothetical protein KBC79_03130 [Candidatus Woesebacteria bacterium]|nr:hypothetical protein [Candidatus Woesebacteria bacterium]